MQRARQVAGLVRHAAFAGFAEIPPTVDDAKEGIVDGVRERRNVDQRSLEADRHLRNAQRSGVSPIGASTSGSPEPSAGRSRPVM